MLIPTCIIKFLELSITVACLVLHQYSYDLTDLPTLMLCSGTYVGYVVILSGEIIGEMLFAPLDLVQDIFFGVLGVVMFSVSGGLVLSSRIKESPYPKTGDHTAALLVGSISSLNALIMLFDVSLAYLDSDEYENEPREAVSAAPDAYVDAWWSAAGAALFGACGGFTMKCWREIPMCHRKNLANSAAICASVVSALMAFDALLAICSSHKDETSSKNKSNRPNVPV